jgi:hypothetical protein
MEISKYQSGYYSLSIKISKKISKKASSALVFFSVLALICTSLLGAIFLNLVGSNSAVNFARADDKALTYQFYFWGQSNEAASQLTVFVQKDNMPVNSDKGFTDLQLSVKSGDSAAEVIDAPVDTYQGQVGTSADDQTAGNCAKLPGNNEDANTAGQSCVAKLIFTVQPGGQDMVKGKTYTVQIVGYKEYNATDFTKLGDGGTPVSNFTCTSQHCSTDVEPTNQVSNLMTITRSYKGVDDPQFLDPKGNNYGTPPTPCAYSADLADSDPKCVPCDYDNTILASDPDCVKPADNSDDDTPTVKSVKITNKSEISTATQGDTITLEAENVMSDGTTKTLSASAFESGYTVTSSVPEDTVSGNKVTFNHASPHVITVTSKTDSSITTSFTVQVSPAQVIDNEPIITKTASTAILTILAIMILALFGASAFAMNKAVRNWRNQ